MLQLMRKFLKAQRGSVLLEYDLEISLVAVALIFAISAFLGAPVRNKVQTMDRQMNCSSENGAGGVDCSNNPNNQGQ